MTTLRDGDLLATLQQIEGYVPPPSAYLPARDRCYVNSKMPAVYRKVMYGKGPMTTLQIAEALARRKAKPRVSCTKSAINACILQQLVPKGLVKTIKPKTSGPGNVAIHEWIGE